MNKVDLQSRVDSLFGEVNFLKQLFEIVSSILIRNPCLFSYLTWGTGCERGRPETQGCLLGTPLPSHLNSVDQESAVLLTLSTYDSWMGVLEKGGVESPEVGEGETIPTSV